MRFVANSIACLAAAAALSLAAPSPARSGQTDACPHTDTIAAYARRILNDRKLLHGFAQRRFGAEAAHLLINYGGLNDAKVRAMLEGLLSDKVGQTGQLAIAWAYGRGAQADREWLAALPGVDPIADGGFSGHHAILNLDDGVTLFRLLKARPEPLPGHRSIGMALWTGHAAARWDAGRKQAFAARATAAGRPEMAAAVLATGPSREAYERYLAEHAGSSPALKLFDPRGAFNNLLTLPNMIGPGTPISTRYAQDEKMYALLRAGFEMGETDFLVISLNQTGRMDEFSRIGFAINAAIDRGELDPTRDPEAGWILAYELMVAELGRTEADSTLRSFDTGGRRHYRGLARDSIDWAIAGRAIGDWLAAGSHGVPLWPTLLSDGFRWEAWMKTAMAVADGRFDPGAVTSAGAAKIAAEVLHAAGRYHELFELAAGEALRPRESLAILRDIALRLDRRCAGHAVWRGQAILLGGDTMFRFDR